VNVNFLLLRTV